MARRRHREIAAIVTFLAGCGPLAHAAAASPGWSMEPRWSLPADARDDCPGRRGLGRREVRARRALACRSAVVTQEPPPATAPVPAPARAPVRLPPPPAADVPGEAPPALAAPRTTFASHDEVAALSPGACARQLEDAGVAFDPVPAGEAPQVEQPIRLRGPIAGVTYRIPWSRDADDPHAIWDCRLAAALLPVSSWLAAHGITEVHYISVLRRGAMARRKPRSRHNVGLAIDVLGLLPADGPIVTVEGGFPRGVLRECPPPVLTDRFAALYVGLVCFAARHGSLQTILTPDHDRAHENHLHLDVSPHPGGGERFVSFAD